MQRPATQRRLAAILAADVVGYSRLMQEDDQATLQALTECRKLFAERVAARGGRIVNAPGDSILSEFPSVLDAIECAIDLQRELAARDASVPGSRRMQFRMGINLGDVLADADGIYGDGVNIAARLEGLCEAGGVTLSASAYEQVRDKTAFRFVDLGEHMVKNIARPVHIYALDPQHPRITKKRLAVGRRRALAAAIAVAAVTAGLLAAPELSKHLYRPAEPSAASIAVLPFANQSGDAKHDYFSDGVTEDVINALGRFSGIRVIAHNAVQLYKDRIATAEQVSRELGVRYLVQGSVRQAEGRLRVGVELSDATKGTLLWSDRYDGEGKEVFDIQDRIVKNIVGVLAVKVTRLEQQRAASKPRASLEAYDLVLRARELLGRIDRGANREARGLAAQALQHSPNYGEAHVVLAQAELQRAALGWIENVEEAIRRCEAHAQRALVVDDAGANARAHAVLGTLYSITGRFEQALQHADRALEFNSSDAKVFAARGVALLWTGHIDQAIVSGETALRFDPRLREGTYFLALAYYLAERYTDAVTVADGALAQNPNLLLHQAVRAAALAQLGRTDEAQRAAEEVRKLNPFFQTNQFGERLTNPAYRAAIQEGLRKAGL